MRERIENSNAKLCRRSMIFNEIFFIEIDLHNLFFKEMIYPLAQYAQTFLDEYRPRKRTPPIIPPPIEPNPENDVSQIIER